jgi:hypothetical protein
MGKSGGPITKDDTGVEYYGTVFALTESIHEAGVFWAGSDDGRLHLTRDGGETWVDVTPGSLPEWAMINSIDIDPFAKGGAYVAATRYKMDDFQPYLYHTENWGRTWKRVHGDLPKDHFTRVLRADPQQQGLLYAGTERGAYYSENGGRNWQPLQLNLPVTPITDLQVRDDDLIAATQGRGFWILDDLPVLRQQAASATSGVRLYAPGEVYRLVAGSRSENPGHAGTNPYDGVSLFYELPEDFSEADSLSLEVLRAGDEEPIWTWLPEVDGDEADEDDSISEQRVLSTEPGLHRHVWNLEYPGMERFDGLILWSDMKEGPKAVPGEYIARLTAGDAVQVVAFDVLPDPRSQATAEAYEAQFRFVVEARDLLSRTHEEIGRIRTLRAQLDGLRERLGQDADDLLGRIDDIDAAVTAVEEALYQTKNRSRQDPLNYPIRLNNKLTSLMRLVAGDDRGPTSQAWEVKAMLSDEIEAQLNTLDGVWREQLPALNAAIRDSGMDMLAL